MSDLDELAKVTRRVDVPARRPAHVSVEIRRPPSSPLRLLLICLSILVIVIAVAVGWSLYQANRVSTAVGEISQATVDKARQINEGAAAKAATDEAMAAKRKAVEEHFPGGLAAPASVLGVVHEFLPDEILTVNERTGDIREKRLVYRTAGLFISAKPNHRGDGWEVSGAVDVKTNAAISLAAATSRIVGAGR